MPTLPTYDQHIQPPPPPPQDPGKFTAKQKTALSISAMCTVLFTPLFIAAACSPLPPPSPAPAPTVTVTVTAQAPQPTSPAPAPALMPQAVGATFTDAVRQIEAVGGGAPQSASAYTDVEVPADHATWKVCFQTPDKGAPVKPGETRLVLAAPDVKCPDKEGTRLTPEPVPAPPPAPKPEPTPDTDEGSTSSSGGSGSSGGGTTGVGFGRSCSPVGATATTADGRPAKCFMGKDGKARWGYNS
ncbi:PASTA domain-containing protein [Streptomyces sp. NBC_01351]|uniref:PASTA domain-containing protein n=1 Tax=Streptomyces sp. NBC_01351 TaxID=2903833 RepID=UPI002E31515F|nr:PASTA domain-containing protein [Streptomyces sp. NBC_01351]